MQEMIRRYITSVPAMIFDIGGGLGVYPSWLAGCGYETYLIDIAPLRVM